MSMSLHHNVGARLITPLIDQVAKQTPDKAYASIPRTEDLLDGFIDVTYHQFSNAINHASWWLDSELDGDGQFCDTFAYAGPKDLRYAIIAVAAAKTGRRVLLPSSFVTPQAQLHLLDVTKSRSYLCTTSNETEIVNLLKEKVHVRVKGIPEERDWLFAQDARHYPYEKTWQDNRDDPWIIFHTSGTTGKPGLPKPIVYTNLMMTSLDATLTMPESIQELQSHHYIGERWYSPLPSLHFVGMTTLLQMTVLLDMVVVLGPANQPATAPLVDQILHLANVTGMISPPSLIESLCENPPMLENLRKLEYVHYVGAPLNKRVGDLISRDVVLLSALGSTEAGPYFVRVHTDPDWSYHSFCPSIGLEFEKRTDDLYEAVFHRKKGLERWQQIFLVYPQLDRFPTSDLMRRHPTNPNLWAFAGRTDDLVTLSHGNSLPATQMEAIIAGHPHVRAALIGGDGRAKPFLILDLAEEKMITTGPRQDRYLTDNLWPIVDEANEGCVVIVRLTKELTMLATSEKPFKWTAKGTVMRRATIESYHDEINFLYHDRCETKHE